MELTGQQRFESSPGEIWTTVFDPDVMVACIPGGERVERISETEFEGTIERGLAALNVEMAIDLEVVEDDRPDSVVATLHGRDNRINSEIDGDATIGIETDGDGTSTLSYVADLTITGRLSSLGARLLKRQMTSDLDTFFSNLAEHVEAE